MLLKLFLYFFELVLRTPCKPRPFPLRETYSVFCEETSFEVYESRPTGLDIALFNLAALTSAQVGLGGFHNVEKDFVYFACPLVDQSLYAFSLLRCYRGEQKKRFQFPFDYIKRGIEARFYLKVGIKADKRDYSCVCISM